MLVLYGERGRAKVSIHYSRVIFLGFTPAISEFPPEFGNESKYPFVRLLGRIGVLAYHDRGVWPFAMTEIWKAIRLLVLTSLRADVEIRRFAEAVRRCNRELFLGC